MSNVKRVYKVRYTDRVSGKSHIIGYTSVRRAWDALGFAASLSIDSNTYATYLGSEKM